MNQNDKKIIRIILISIIVIVVAYYLKVATAVQNLGYGVGKIKNFKFGSQITWNQEILITNGDVVDIPINSVSLLNYIGGYQVGSTILEQKQTIKAKATNSIIFKVIIPYTDLLAAGAAIVSSVKSGKFSLRLKGQLNSLLLNPQIDQTFKLDINKL
jgi:hypothetical protein